MTAAFDRVNVPILMAKLRFLNVNNHVLEWIERFLAEREIKTTLENQEEFSALYCF